MPTRAQVRDLKHDWGWGCIVNFQKDGSKDKDKSDKVRHSHTSTVLTCLQGKAPIRVDVLLKCKKGSSGKEAPEPCGAAEAGEMLVVPVLLGSFERLSSVRIFMPEDIRARDVRAGLAKSIEEVGRRFPDGACS